MGGWGGGRNEASLEVPLDPALYVYSPESEKEFRGLKKELHVDLTRHFSHPDTYMYPPPPPPPPPEAGGDGELTFIPSEGTLIKKEKILLVNREIQKGSGANHMTNGFLIYDQIFAHFLTYSTLLGSLPHILYECTGSLLNFLYMRKKFSFLFYQSTLHGLKEKG